MGQTLLLSEQDVRALLPMEDVVAAVEKTFRLAKDVRSIAAPFIFGGTTHD